MRVQRRIVGPAPITSRFFISAVVTKWCHNNVLIFYSNLRLTNLGSSITKNVTQYYIIAFIAGFDYNTQRRFARSTLLAVPKGQISCFARNTLLASLAIPSSLR